MRSSYIPQAKSIAITGVSRGLGRALAWELSQLGHRVFGCAPERASKSCPFHVANLNINDARAVSSWQRFVAKESGGIDLLINNAALTALQSPAWELPARSFNLVIDTNIKGCMNVMRSFLPDMISKKTGIVVNVLSGGAQRCLAGGGAYNASKWAMEGLTKTISIELPKGVAIVGLFPGATNTPMLRKIIGKDALVNPSPEDWAKRAAPFLLSIKSTHNGKLLRVPSSMKTS